MRNVQELRKYDRVLQSCDTDNLCQDSIRGLLEAQERMWNENSKKQNGDASQNVEIKGVVLTIKVTWKTNLQKDVPQEEKRRQGTIRRKIKGKNLNKKGIRRDRQQLN